jgi:hypothetical protein
LHVHTLDVAAQMVATQFGRNPASRPSAMFRRLRRSQYLTAWADYPLLYTIFSTTAKLGVSMSRGQIRHAIKQSSQLAAMSRSDRRRFLNQLESQSRATGNGHAAPLLDAVDEELVAQALADTEDVADEDLADDLEADELEGDDLEGDELEDEDVAEDEADDAEADDNG